MGPFRRAMCRGHCHLASNAQFSQRLACLLHDGRIRTAAHINAHPGLLIVVCCCWHVRPLVNGYYSILCVGNCLSKSPRANIVAVLHSLELYSRYTSVGSATARGEVLSYPRDTQHPPAGCHNGIRRNTPRGSAMIDHESVLAALL